MVEGIAARTAWELVDALRALVGGDKRKASNEGVGIVTRVDESSRPWIMLPGSDGETPANGQVLSDVKAGDVVRWRIEGGQLSIVGNATTPSVGGAYVNGQVSPVAKRASEAWSEALDASSAASEARKSADSAAEAADSAWEHADDAQSAADAAQESADGAAGAAAAALQSAGEAGASAEGARASADGALYQLSVIEDVVGTVEWLAAHATWSATSDATVEAGKTYYELSGGSYQPVALQAVTYSQTADAAPQEGTTYYTLADGSYVEADVLGGFAQGVTYYVATQTDPSALGLYEASASESLQAYVMSHLALTDSGLWITVDDSGYRMRLSSSGWEVLDADGQSVTATIADAQGHVTATLGRLDGLHLTVTESRLAFSYPNGSETVEVAWIEVDPETGASSFHITNAVVMRELRIGSWKWYERAGGNLALKWIGV